MLNTIKQSLRSDPEGTLRRLTSAGYQIELETARNWDPVDYLAQTLSLPMISARYIPYELRIDTVMVDRRRATVEMIFETASGAEIPQQGPSRPTRMTSEGNLIHGNYRLPLIIVFPL